MAFEYIKELYVRIIFCIYTFVLSFFGFFTYREEYFYWFAGNIWQLVDNGTFIFTGITEVFGSYFYLSLALSCYVFLWMCIINIYLYILPGLYKKEAKKVFELLFLSFIIFIILFSLLHYYTINIFCSYLLDYKETEGLGGLTLNFEPRLSEIIYFLIKVDLIIFIILLSLCVSLCLISLSKKEVLVNLLNKSRKYVYIGVLFIIISLFPADFILHLLVFISVGILYELGCMLICIKRCIS